MVQLCAQQEAICMYERVLADRCSRSRDRRHHRTTATGSGNDVMSDERTLIGSTTDYGLTPTRRYV